MAIRAQIKSLGSDTLVYGIGNVLTKIVAFILIPIYTRYLDLADVGYYAILEMVELLAVSFILSGMQYSLWRFLPKSDPVDLPKLIISGFAGTAIVGGALLGLLSLSSGTITALVGLDKSLETLVKLVLLNILFSFGFRYFLYYLQYKRATFYYILISLFQLIGICGLTIWFVVFKGFGLYGLIVAKTITLGFLFLVVLFSLIKETKVTPTIRHYLQMAKYGIPLIPMLLVFPVLNVFDRFFLNIFVTPDQIGIYSVAYRIGMILQMVLVMPLQRSWLPMMYKMGIDEGENRDIIRDALFYFAVIGGILFLTISAWGEPILRFASTESYVSGARFIPIVLGAYFLNGFRVFFLSAAALKDKNKTLGLISLSGMVANMILNYVLIGRYGPDGAAWATAISFLYLTAVIYFFSQKEVYINWKWARLAKLGVVILVLFVGFNELSTALPQFNIFSPFLILVVYGLLLLGLGIVGKRELNGLKQLLSKLNLTKT